MTLVLTNNRHCMKPSTVRFVHEFCTNLHPLSLAVSVPRAPTAGQRSRSRFRPMSEINVKIVVSSISCLRPVAPPTSTTRIHTACTNRIHVTCPTRIHVTYRPESTLPVRLESTLPARSSSTQHCRCRLTHATTARARDEDATRRRALFP